jgi:pimeloyl-ACP methyl ester carboxylesterase
MAVGPVDLCLAEAGAGGRPFLLVHGFTGAKEDFTDFLDPLADRGWWAVAHDHRGHGASSKPDDEAAYSTEILAGDALALVDGLGWDHFVLLGHSMGGMVAQHLIAKAGDRIDGLILMDTSSGPLNGFDRNLIETAAHVARTQGMDGLAEAMAARGAPLSTPAHERLLAERPGYAEFGDRKFRATSPLLYAALLMEMANRTDMTSTLAGFTKPALVLVGEEDKPFLDPSRLMADTLPDGALVVLADAGHSPQFENPTAWWAALSGFLDVLVSDSRSYERESDTKADGGG